MTSTPNFRVAEGTTIVGTRAEDHRLRITEAWRLTGVSALWVGALIVVAIWVRGGGLQDLLSPLTGGAVADTLTSSGRITGLVASYLLLLQVLLMARVPLFERAFGHDALTRSHRRTGFWSFWLIIAHVVLIVLGYAATASQGVLAELWQVVTTFEDMLPATLGTLGFVALVFLSLRRLRRAQRWETWHLLHLYAYVGVVLVLPHQLSTGADFVGSQVASVFWWSLWSLAAACTLVFRIVRPLWMSAHHQLHVESVRPDGERGVTVVIAGSELHTMGTQAGQFFVWHFLDGHGWPWGHPFSVSSLPDDSHLNITVRVVGDGTRRIAALRPGTRVIAEGPYGHMTAGVRRGRDLLMIGAGAGVAPLVSLLEVLPYSPGHATLVVRDSTAGAILLDHPIRQLVSTRGLTALSLLGPRSRGGSPWVPEALRPPDGPSFLGRWVRDPSLTDVYLCGPGPWMASVRKDLHRLGFTHDHVHFENFNI